LNDKASFDNIEKWLQQIEESAPKECCKMLVGTKKDCEENRVISYETAEKLAIKVGIKYMETSAKSG
jgi:GTPase SAR1 family protein